MEWRDVKGYEGIYIVSSNGQVKRLPYISKTPDGLLCQRKGRVLKPWFDKKGYQHIELCDKGRTRTVTVHRVVAEAFLPNPDNKPQINHIDCDKTNNAASNLEWCNNSENQLHAYAHGLQKSCFQHHNSKLSLEQVLEIKHNCVPGNKGNGMLIYAKKFGVSYATIQQIIRGQSYKNIN